jgi:hypothetical protein
MARRGNTRGCPRVEADDTALATSACETITDLMGEIHAARVVGVLAVRQPVLFQTARPNFIVRIATSAIALALRKFEDLWRHQIKAILLRHSIPSIANSGYDTSATSAVLWWLTARRMIFAIRRRHPRGSRSLWLNNCSARI